MSEKREHDLHFVLRYSDELHGHDTIVEHRKILEKRGYVWMGKFGLGIAQTLVEKVNTQIESGSASYVYLSAYSKIKYRARVMRVVGGGVSARLACPEKGASPKYYASTPCSVWFKLSSISDSSQADVKNLRLYNSPGLAPAFTSMRGLVYVTESSSGSRPMHREKKRTKKNQHADILLEEFDW